MDIRVDGRVAIVTGGSRGIGRSIAGTLAAAGAKVMITSRKADVCEAAVAELSEETGGDLAFVAGNVGLAEDAERVVEATLSTFGAVDILVNNAGVTRDNLLMRMSEEEWDTVLNTNLKGAFNFTKALTRPFIKQ
ncbi:MAG: SDR family NAD(P)-dependent oxidoreductase, partial [Acidimicrobiales bacterium]|nr:SDR family NAD(P)-dependent oxidoreductase [Acidimicrobiales bacterium]